MPFGRQRRRARFGLPEYVALVLIGATAAFAGLWLRAAARPEWRIALGTVVRGEMQPIHYNAPSTSYRVSIDYSYSLDGRNYSGSWVGYWPEFGSPNALPRERHGELLKPGRPLTIFYDPANKSKSHLHGPAGDEGLWLAAGATGAGAAAIGYCVVAYPRWRHPRRGILSAR